MPRDKPKYAPEDQLSRADLHTVADALGSRIGDEEMGLIMTLVYALTYERNIQERELMSCEIERAFVWHTTAATTALENIRREETRFAIDYKKRNGTRRTDQSLQREGGVR